MSASAIRLGGYQGDASILTLALTRLAGLMQGCALNGALEGPVQTEVNVTASGESAASLFASVDQGQRQICYMASGYLSARVPELAVLDVPFSVTDRVAALRALDGDAGRWLSEAVAQRTGYQVLGFWDNGFRHLSNRVRPIATLQDCRGLSIRTLDSASYRDTFAALGFEPRSIDVKDLVRVVQSGEVDAQENPLTNLLNFALWQYHPFVSLSGHFFGVLLLVCHRAWFDALTPAQQEALRQAAMQATQLQRKLAADEDARALAQLKAHGVQVLAPGDIDLDALRQASASVAMAQRAALPQALVQAYLNT